MVKKLVREVTMYKLFLTLHSCLLLTVSRLKFILIGQTFKFKQEFEESPEKALERKSIKVKQNHYKITNQISN
jgi:hypothetical protein